MSTWVVSDVHAYLESLTSQIPYICQQTDE
jgi:hypothetical protein